MPAQKSIENQLKSENSRSAGSPRVTSPAEPKARTPSQPTVSTAAQRYAGARWVAIAW